MNKAIVYMHSYYFILFPGCDKPRFDEDGRRLSDASTQDAAAASVAAAAASSPVLRDTDSSVMEEASEAELQVNKIKGNYQQCT